MKGLIIISHPGHEVAAYHFIHQYQSQIYCLTDGSSGTGIARHYDCHHSLVKDGFDGYLNIDSVLQEAFIYKSILAQDFEFFQKKITQLRCILETVNPDIILMDAYEGYNPIHDLLHCCAKQASKCFITQHQEALCLKIKLTEQDYCCSRKHRVNSVEKEFTGTERSRQKKFDYAIFLSNYINEIPVHEETLKRLSNQPEKFSIVDKNVNLDYFLFSDQPFYERHGKSRVEAGKFHKAIEFNNHILPLITKIYAFS